ncbi:TonB-dependent receptor plug domain-containing protein [Fuscovulum blasticum]|uniref:TonB-dependent receptor plug domain-containing protein n=1 Tax=Fuscovulum blasticum TaxID=1075 RepID=UPI000F4DE753|nr:TonB-dependent receptor [Fuscovulum blasticum]
MYGISRIALISALAASGLAAPALAADDDDSLLLGTITITASTEPVELGRTGATVDVVTADDLKKSGDQSVATLLARLPGVSMSRNGGLGTSTALRLRGLSGPYIGVRIDGIDVSDPSGTQCAYDFGSTTSGGISRIEVLRGSQSALFGSEAIGGVVDITTFRATEEGTSAQIGVEAGSNATYSGTASVAMKTDRVELAFSASRTITDGISSYAYGTEDDAFRSTTLTFFGAYQVSDTLRIGMSLLHRDSFTEFDDQTADNGNIENGKLRGGRIFAELQTGAVTHELSYAHTDSKRDYSYPTGWYSETSFDGGREQLAYLGKWKASEQLSLNWGLDRTKETFDGSSTSIFGTALDGGKATTKSVFAELLYAPDPSLDISLAVRHDDHETFGGYDTGRLALAWRPADDWIIRAVASTGFRAPSLYELYSVDYGNPALQPETSTNFELGAEYLFSADSSLQVTLFHTEIEDRIQWAGGAYNQVPGTTTTKGVEVTGRAALAPGWSMFGNYTYTDATNVNGGVETVALRVPRHDLTLGVEGQITDRLSGLVTVQHVADYWDAGLWPAPASRLKDYTVANLTVSYEVNDQTEAYLRVENLFDEDYQTVRNYGQPGRSVYLGMRTSF